jgi:hypothetical protein
MSKKNGKQFRKQRAAIITQNKKSMKAEHKESKQMKPRNGQHNGYFWARWASLATGIVLFLFAAYYYMLAIQWSISGMGFPEGEGLEGIFGLFGWAGYGPAMTIVLWGYAIGFTIVGLVFILVSQFYLKKRAW